MIYTLYHVRTRPTGRVIAKALGAPSFGIRRPRVEPRVLVRWGNSLPVPGNYVEINSAEAIKAASDKLSSLNRFTESAIEVPPYTTSKAEAEWWQRERGWVVFGRTRWGSKGRGITVYERGDEIGQHQLYTRWINSAREYRLHVVDGAVLRVQGKYNDFPERNKGPYVKNHGTGFRFRAPRQNLHARRIEAGINAVRALGLDFGAVDLILDNDGNQFVLEVNTGPSCSPLTAEAYVSGLASLIADKTEGRIAPQPRMEALAALRE